MQHSKAGPNLKRVMEDYALDTLWHIAAGVSNVSEQSEEFLKPLPPFLDTVGNPSHLWRHIVRSIVTLKPINHPDAVEMNIRTHINKTVRKLVEENLSPTDVEDEKGRATFLERVSMESGGTRQQPITADVMAQALQIYGFGHEASALLLYWGIYELSRRPEAVQTLRNELHATSRSVTDLDFNRIQDMKYLDAIFNELLRLYCPISTSARMVTRPIVTQTRQNNPVLLPKGAQVFLSIHMLHHDEQIWGSTASTFSPERWTATHKNSLENRSLQVKTLLAVLFFDSEVRIPATDVVKCVGVVVRPTKATEFEVRKV